MQEEYPIIKEDPDIKLENNLKEMEDLMQSLQKILDENTHVMSIPDNQEEFLLYNHINNQSFTNNDPNNKVNYDVNYNKIYFINKLEKQVINYLNSKKLNF